MKADGAAGKFDGLSPGVAQWLHYEQTVNERLTNPKVYARLEHGVKDRFIPERRPVWEQEVVWLPRSEVRCYGTFDAEMLAAFGIEESASRAPLFVHPQAPAAHRRLARIHGSACLPGVLATPTASYRSVLAWNSDDDSAAVILKLSIGAKIGRIRRGFREDQISRAVIVSTLLDHIPKATRRRLNFDWFSEPAGLVETQSRQGWMLRQFPAALRRNRGTRTCIPIFSLISRRGEDPPLLVEWIRRSRQKPETFILERLLQPYVAVMAYLLFQEGLECEGHSQNVLVEADRHDEFTGRLYFRDLSDTTINIPMRLARRKLLPKFPPSFLPAAAPLSHVAETSDFRHRNRLIRGFDTVEKYGLWAFVWPISTSMAGWFKRYNSDAVESEYLRLWQEAAIEHLHLKPLLCKDRKGLATDEAIAHFLGKETDWRSLGATPSALPASAEPLPFDGQTRRRRGTIYDRLNSPWGDLFVLNGRPEFFRAAF